MLLLLLLRVQRQPEAVELYWAALHRGLDYRRHRPAQGWTRGLQLERWLHVLLNELVLNVLLRCRSKAPAW